MCIVLRIGASEWLDLLLEKSSNTNLFFQCFSFCGLKGILKNSVFAPVIDNYRPEKISLQTSFVAILLLEKFN